MNLNIEDLLDDAMLPEIPVAPVSLDLTERICDKTMKKIQKMQHPRRIRPMRVAIAAAAAAALLCGSAFAAYENGWFGFDQVFGAETAQVEPHIVVYSAQESDEAQAQVDTTADASQDAVTYTADTTDYRFTLESMLSGQDSLYAIVRMEPLTDYGKSHMGLTDQEGFDMIASNTSDDVGGSLSCTLTSTDDQASYYLLTASGCDNHVGDLVNFEVLSIPTETGETSASLFSVALTDVMDTEKTISLDRAVYSDLNYLDTLTITPLSLTITGWYDCEAYENAMIDNGDGSFTVTMDEPAYPKVTITLTDGTSFSLANGETVDLAEYGTYGSMNVDFTISDQTNVETCTWTFSQVVDLDAIAEINVDGVAYTLD
jgi:hypothetical protein